jgi:putative ABC transport system substrate-binding protein
MNRRDAVLALASLCAAGAPLTSLAQQQTKIFRVGFLSVRSPPPSVDADPLYQAFRDGMRDLGYVEGKNLVIEWRFGDGKFERLVDLAAELVRTKVDVIVTQAQGTAAAQKAGTSIPIVSAVIMEDPVAAGYAASLARPGGNITGLTPYTSDLVAKYLELLMAAVPKVSRVAVLGNPENPSNAVFLKAIQAAAQKSKLTVLPLNARTPQEIDLSYGRMSLEKATAAVILPDGFYLQQVRQLAELAIKHRIPSIWGGRQYADAGGLMSYGFSAVDNYRRAAIFVDKILRGAKPGDLPIEQSMRFELVINRRTAKGLGLTIPQSLLLRADEVIE